MTNDEVQEIIDRAEDEYDRLKDRVHEQYDEIERLNNIINELESFINMALEIYDNVDLPTLRMIKDKIKELKENDNV